MSKSMTTESVASTFSAATQVGVDSGKGPIQSNYKFAPGDNAANKLQQHRNGTPRQYDDAKDRGPAIGNAAGHAPTSMKVPA